MQRTNNGELKRSQRVEVLALFTHQLESCRPLYQAIVDDLNATKTFDEKALIVAQKNSDVIHMALRRVLDVVRAFPFLESPVLSFVPNPLEIKKIQEVTIQN